MSVVIKNLILDFEMVKRKKVVLSIEEKQKVCEMFGSKISKTDIILKDNSTLVQLREMAAKNVNLRDRQPKIDSFKAGVTNLFAITGHFVTSQ